MVPNSQSSAKSTCHFFDRPVMISSILLRTLCASIKARII